MGIFHQSRKVHVQFDELVMADGTNRGFAYGCVSCSGWSAALRLCE